MVSGASGVTWQLVVNTEVVWPTVVRPTSEWRPAVKSDCKSTLDFLLFCVLFFVVVKNFSLGAKKIEIHWSFPIFQRPQTFSKLINWILFFWIEETPIIALLENKEPHAKMANLFHKSLWHNKNSVKSVSWRFEISFIKVWDVFDKCVQHNKTLSSGQRRLLNTGRAEKS